MRIAIGVRDDYCIHISKSKFVRTASPKFHEKILISISFVKSTLPYRIFLACYKNSKFVSKFVKKRRTIRTRVDFYFLTFFYFISYFCESERTQRLIFQFSRKYSSRSLSKRKFIDRCSNRSYICNFFIWTLFQIFNTRGSELDRRYSELSSFLRAYSKQGYVFTINQPKIEITPTLPSFERYRL